VNCLCVTPTGLLPVQDSYGHPKNPDWVPDQPTGAPEPFENSARQLRTAHGDPRRTNDPEGLPVKTPERWDVEDERFGAAQGKAIADRNVWISIPNPLCAFTHEPILLLVN